MKNEFTELYHADLKRYGGVKRGAYIKRFHKYFRKAQTSKNRLAKLYYRLGFIVLRKSHGIEMSEKTRIGKGLYIGHPYGITINPEAEIGETCNIHKGVLIGQENRGARKGAPVIGDRVWIGINAAVTGKIKIGNDVLIAPNSYVNRDVPDHSVVFGNPCVIKHRDNATEQYI